MNLHNPEVQNQVLKASSAWVLIGVTSWTDVAAFLGAIYSLLLISEWVWKKAIRPLLVARGFVAAQVQRKDQDDE